MAGSAVKALDRARLTTSEDGEVYRDGEPVAVSVGKTGYLKVNSNTSTFKVHRLVAEDHLGMSLESFPAVRQLCDGAGRWEIAHKDGDKKNNRASNLQHVPHSFNMLHWHTVGCPCVRLLTSIRGHRLFNANHCGRSRCPAIRGCLEAEQRRRRQVAVEAFWNSERGSRRREIVGRSLRIYSMRHAKLDECKVREIRSLKGVLRSGLVARSFSVSRTTVQRIWRGEDWAGVR